MKKAQLNYFLIIGAIVVVLMAFSVYYTNLPGYNTLKREQEENSGLSFSGQNFQDVFDSCADDAIVRANKLYGIPSSDNSNYKSYLKTEIKSCVDGVLDTLTEQGYEVEKGELVSGVDINDDTVIIASNYPVTITRGTSVSSFSEHTATFNRAVTVALEDGVVKEDLTINSVDNSAKLVLRAGIKVTDENGNPMDSISIRVEDVHFDDMNNGAVVGKLVYEGLPDGAQFSEPIELYMRLSAADKPSMISDSELSIAYFNEEFQYWEGLPSFVTEDGLIGTKDVKHFTMFAVVKGCSYTKGAVPSTEFETPLLFKQRYSFMADGEDALDGTTFKDDEEKEGTDSLAAFDTAEKTAPEICTDDFWIKDGDAFIPNDKEYAAFLKYQEESEGFGGETVYDINDYFEKGFFPSLNSNIIKYGQEEGICKDNSDPEQKAKVEPYACCYKDSATELVCYSEVVDRQECVKMIYSHSNGAIYDKLKQDKMYLTKSGSDYRLMDPNAISESGRYTISFSSDKSFSDVIGTLEDGFAYPATDKLDRKMFGYEEAQCVGGTTFGEDKNDKAFIYKIYLEPEGGDCLLTSEGSIRETDKIKVEYLSDYGTCQDFRPMGDVWGQPMQAAEQKAGIMKDEKGTFIGLFGIQVTPEDSSYCADCKAKFTFEGMKVDITDTEYEYTCTKEEAEGNAFKVIYDSGSPMCYMCIPTNEKYTYMEQQGPCSIEGGCGKCLDYSGSLFGTCASNFEGDTFCQKDKAYKCTNGQLAAIDKATSECPSCESAPENSRPPYCSPMSPPIRTSERWI
ncbi:MAG: hypothetical protein NDI94_02410 [Candidatus Woesearchaeota archaeon]|nr:hypothetical protein [Candidatus Woesearchaeota archaeon]